eukprot:6588746-Alexandrium_andersonii.AAC.1
MPHAPHSSVLPGTRSAPEVAMDYCFFTKDASETSLTVLVLKDRDSQAILAHPVLRKGCLHEDTVDQAVSSIHRLGHLYKVLLKTDDEPALVDLRAGVAEKLGLRRVTEAPPAREPQPNGSVENAVKQLK